MALAVENERRGADRGCWCAHDPCCHLTPELSCERINSSARPLDVLTTVFKRPFVQVALGIGAGAILGFGLANDDLSKVHLDVLGNAAVFALSTILCCALACIVPTRRALRIQPTEALKDEG